jgi:hypothetical protein
MERADGGDRVEEREARESQLRKNSKSKFETNPNEQKVENFKMRSFHILGFRFEICVVSFVSYS